MFPLKEKFGDCPQWPTVVDVHFAPLDSELIVNAPSYTKKITVDEGVLSGGFGALVLELLEKHGISNVKVK